MHCSLLRARLLYERGCIAFLTHWHVDHGPRLGLGVRTGASRMVAPRNPWFIACVVIAVLFVIYAIAVETLR